MKMEILSRSIQTIVLAMYLISLMSCHKNPTSPPPETPHLLTADEYRDLSFTFVDYDVVNIVNRAGTTFHSDDIFAVGVGQKDSSGYHEITKINSTYSEQTSLYTTSFDLTLRLDSTKTDLSLTVRYYHPFSYDDVDTMVVLYAYPYPNAIVVLSNAVTGSNPGVRFQDVAHLGNKLYVRQFPDSGLFEYDFGSSQFNRILNYAKGRVVAADSGYVFCDSLSLIGRFNLQTHALDLVMDPFHDPSASYTGLTTYQGMLYVALAGKSTIYQLTYDGAVIDSFNVPMLGHYLTIADSVVYSVGFDGPPDRLSRFDLRTGVEFTSVKSPAYVVNGITIDGGLLYYCDYLKRFVGTIPLADLVP